MYQIEFHPQAIHEIREAIEWYRQRNEDTGQELRALTKAAEELIRRSPHSCAAYLHDTRGYRFQKFPFILVFVIPDDRISFVAMAHTRRKPGYWRQRLDAEASIREIPSPRNAEGGGGK